MIPNKHWGSLTKCINHDKYVSITEDDCAESNNRRDVLRIWQLAAQASPPSIDLAPHSLLVILIVAIIAIVYNQ